MTSGYEGWGDLLYAEPAVVCSKVRATTGQTIAVSQVARWQEHALSYEAGVPVVRQGAGPFPVPSEYVALDLEYEPAQLVWIMGLRVVGPEPRALYWLADTPVREAEALGELDDVLRSLPGLPLVTWNGQAADFPELRRAACRAGLEAICGSLEERHVDLYRWADASLALPISSIGLKEVSLYLGVTRNADVGSGFEALSMWKEYQRSRSVGRPKTALRDRLLDYNRDDVDSLVEVTEHLRDLSAGSPLRPGRRLGPLGGVEVRLLETPPARNERRGFFRRAFRFA